MKANRSFMIALLANFIIAVNMNWQPVNKVLVIVSAVLLALSSGKEMISELKKSDEES